MSDPQNTTTETPSQELAPNANPPVETPSEEAKVDTSTTPEPEADDNPADNPADKSADKSSGGSILGGGEDDAADSANTELFGAPEGEYEVDLGEGVTVDKDVLGFVSPLAKELGLSNAGFGKLASVYADKVLPHVEAAVVKGVEDQAAALRAEWAQNAKALVAEDAKAERPVFGGEDFKTVVATSAKAVDQLGPQGFRQFLDETGLGNRPEMLQFCYLVGKALGEDTGFAQGVSDKPKTREEKFYGAKS